jgi:hypothetical protein
MKSPPPPSPNPRSGVHQPSLYANCASPIASPLFQRSSTPRRRCGNLAHPPCSQGVQPYKCEGILHSLAAVQFNVFLHFFIYRVWISMMRWWWIYSWRRKIMQHWWRGALHDSRRSWIITCGREHQSHLWHLDYLGSRHVSHGSSLWSLD